MNSLKNKVYDSVRISVYDSVWRSVDDSVWSSVSRTVRRSVIDSVHDSVWRSVYDSVWNSVHDSVWDSVAVRLNKYKFSKQQNKKIKLNEYEKRNYPWRSNDLQKHSSCRSQKDQTD